MAFDKRLIGLIIIVGFIAGLVGASYTHLLHGIQHFVYHYSAADHMSFGAAVARVSPVGAIDTTDYLRSYRWCGLVSYSPIW